MAGYPQSGVRAQLSSAAARRRKRACCKLMVDDPQITSISTMSFGGEAVKLDKLH